MTAKRSNPTTLRGGDESRDGRAPQLKFEITALHVVEGLLHHPDKRDLWRGRLDTPLRVECVDHMTQQGMSTSEIAKLLGICERTVRRDRRVLRKRFRLRPDADLGNEILGQMQRVMHGSIQRLLKICHDEKVPVKERLAAEQMINHEYRRFVKTLDGLSYIDGRDGMVDEGRRVVKVVAAEVVDRARVETKSEPPASRRQRCLEAETPLQEDTATAKNEHFLTPGNARTVKSAVGADMEGKMLQHIDVKRLSGE